MIGWFGAVLLWLAAFFAVGTIGFWVTMVAFVCGLVALTENLKPGWAATVTAGWLWFIAATGLFNVLSFAREYPWYMCIIVAAYLGLGLFWGWAKWLAYAQKHHSRTASFLHRQQYIRSWDSSYIIAPASSLRDREQ